MRARDLSALAGLASVLTLVPGGQGWRWWPPRAAIMTGAAVYLARRAGRPRPPSPWHELTEGHEHHDR